MPAAAAEHENTKSSRRALVVRRLFSWLVAPMHGLASLATTACLWLFSLAAAARDRVVGVARMAWRIGADDPRKVAHGFKMALALTLCSVFYYVQPLYVFTGQNAMWAVLTVVVVFEYTVGNNQLLSSITSSLFVNRAHSNKQYKYSLDFKSINVFISAASLSIQVAACTKG